MKIIFLIAAAMGLICITLRCEVMETNDLIALSTTTLACYMIYIHDSLEEKIKKNK